MGSFNKSGPLERNVRKYTNVKMDPPETPMYLLGDCVHI